MTTYSAASSSELVDYMPLPISVFIVTQNESQNIKRLLKSIQQFEEIVIVDSGSNDDTVEIAKSYGARVIEKEWQGYAKQKQFAMERCSKEWVLNLDADEEIPKNLIPEIRKVINSNTWQAAKFLRIDYFMGKPMPPYISLPKNIRLYRKCNAGFDATCLVHESARIEGKTKLIKTPFLHYGYNDLKEFRQKLDKYSSLKAIEKHSKGKKASILKLGLIFPFEFLRKLVFQRYMLFGWRGLILSILNAEYSLMKELKLFKLKRNKTKF